MASTPSTPNSEESKLLIKDINTQLNYIRRIDNPPTDQDLNVNQIGASQNILESLKFGIEDSLEGELETERTKHLDKYGKGYFLMLA